MALNLAEAEIVKMDANENEDGTLTYRTRWSAL